MMSKMNLSPNEDAKKECVDLVNGPGYLSLIVPGTTSTYVDIDTLQRLADLVDEKKASKPSEERDSSTPSEKKESSMPPSEESSTNHKAEGSKLRVNTCDDTVHPGARAVVPIRSPDWEKILPTPSPLGMTICPTPSPAGIMSLLKQFSHVHRGVVQLKAVCSASAYHGNTEAFYMKMFEQDLKDLEKKTKALGIAMAKEFKSFNFDYDEYGAPTPKSYSTFCESIDLPPKE
jgi:hypothetical protein